MDFTTVLLASLIGSFIGSWIFHSTIGDERDNGDVHDDS